MEAAGGGGAPTCGRGGCTGRPVAWLPGWRGSLTAWPNAAGLLAWAGWLAWADAAAADDVLGARQARAKAGAAALPCYVCRGTPTARARGSGGGYTGLCRAMDQGAALPRQDWWRGRALPHQRSAVMVIAT